MFRGVCSSFAWLFTGLDDVLGRMERMEQSPSRIVPHTSQTTDTIGDETEKSEPRRRVRSKRTYKMNKVWGADELRHFFCDWANGRFRETQSFLLPHLQERCVCHDPRSTRDIAPLPGDEALSTASASSFRDSVLACASFRRQRHERGRS